MENAYFYQTDLGKIMIVDDEIGITRVSLVDKSKEESLPSSIRLMETELIREAADQLIEYLEGNRREFRVKLNPQGTVFQRQVWDALQNIPYGETRSYKQIAQAIGNEKASRAVGMANHNNPIMCIIPCHRVIGSNGSLVGYAGGLDIKIQLLDLEKATERK